MGKIILILLSVIIIAISATMIYDARTIAQNMFSSNETNDTTKMLKIVGFVITIIGMSIIYVCKQINNWIDKNYDNIGEKIER